MIVVATDDFEVYHEILAELQPREHDFTTIQPEEALPPETDVVLTGTNDAVDEDQFAIDVPIIRTDATGARSAVEMALATLRGDDGRRIIGVDPGDRPGIAVCSGPTVVAAFQIPLADAPDVIADEVAGHEDALVRIGDGARLAGTRITSGTVTGFLRRPGSIAAVIHWIRGRSSLSPLQAEECPGPADPFPRQRPRHRRIRH